VEIDEQRRVRGWLKNGDLESAKVDFRCLARFMGVLSVFTVAAPMPAAVLIGRGFAVRGRFGGMGVSVSGFLGMFLGGWLFSRGFAIGDGGHFRGRREEQERDDPLASQNHHHQDDGK
jgi:hypothetical protein